MPTIVKLHRINGHKSRIESFENLTVGNVDHFLIDVKNYLRRYKSNSELIDLAPTYIEMAAAGEQSNNEVENW